MSSEARRLLFKPHPKQEEFYRAVSSGKYTFLTYGGAMGGGKSYVSIAIIILLCRLYPNSKWVIIRESIPTLKKTALETFKKVCPTNFLEGFNQQDMTATFKNGSRILFMAEDYANDKDFDRFKGLEVNGFLLEQIEELQSGLLDVAMLRAGRHRITPMPRPLILATVNPTQNWVKKTIYEPYINKTLPEDWYYLPATIVDNPELADDPIYMANLKRLDPVNYRRYVLGDWSAFTVDKPFAFCFDEAKHVQPVTYNPALELCLSFDFNVEPITCVVSQNPEIGTIHTVREYRLDNSDIYELCTRIKADYPNALMLVTGDATGAARSALTRGNLNYYTVIREQLGLGAGQMRQPRINPSHEDSRVLCNSLLSNGTVLIDPSCTYLIDDLKYVEVNDEGAIDKTKDAKRSHLLDGWRYNAHTFHYKFLKIRLT